MFDTYEKSRQEVEELLSNISKRGREEMMEMNGKEQDLFNDPFKRQAIKIGLLTQPDTSIVSNYNVLKEYLMSKRFEGCSSQTIKMYYNTLFNFINNPDYSEHVFDIRTVDIRGYLLNKFRYYLDMKRLKPLSFIALSILLKLS